MIDKAALFTPRLPEAEVEVAGLGTVRVRGLSRDEVLAVQQTKGGTGAAERKIVSLGMVDPPLTESEVGQWQMASPAGELEPVTTKISELSGLLGDSFKAAVRTFRDHSGDGVRVLPGDQAGDDGGPDAAGDEQ